MAPVEKWKYHLIMYTESSPPTTDVVPTRNVKITGNKTSVKWGSKWYPAQILKSNSKCQFSFHVDSPVVNRSL